MEVVCFEGGEVIMEMVMGFIERVGGVYGIDEECVKETMNWR